MQCYYNQLNFPTAYFHNYNTSNYQTVSGIDLDHVQRIYKIFGKYSYYVCLLYILVILSLRHFMKYREAFNLKRVLFMWNSILGVFSTVGFLCIAFELISLLLNNNGYYHSVCLRHNSPTLILWEYFFAISKLVEFGDTVFIALRKKPLIFLHWYHHAATLCVVWTVAEYLEPANIWFMVLNFFVHSIMYPYFALKTVGYNIPRWISKSITFMQFLQMLLGMLINVTTVAFRVTGQKCDRPVYAVSAEFLLYASFVILFGNLLWQRKRNGTHFKQE